MNWNPTAYPGGTSLKPIKIDLIRALTEHTIKDLFASLTILYCVGRDLMAAPFSSANIGIGLFELVFFRTSSDWGVPSVCFPSSGKRVGSLGGRGGRPGRKEGTPIHLRQCR